MSPKVAPRDRLRRCAISVAFGVEADMNLQTGPAGPVPIDPLRTFQLFSRDPPLCVIAGCDLTPNDVDVTAQVVHLVREG